MKMVEIAESTGWERIGDRTVAVSLSGGRVAVFSGIEALIWEGLSSGKSESEIVGTVRSRYEASQQLVEADVEQFVSDLRKQGFIK